MTSDEPKPIISSHPEVPRESKSDRKTVVVRFAPPERPAAPEPHLSACLERLEPLVAAHEGTVRKSDPVTFEAFVDLPRMQANGFKTRVLERPDVLAAEFEDVTKPEDPELGVGE